MSITAKEAPSLFSSLPNEIVLNVFARVPRRYHSILSCVSKKLRSLIHSSELCKTRSLMGKDCFYVSFADCHYKTYYQWFSLTEDRHLVSITFPFPPEPCYAALMVGHEIYFFGGSIFQPSSSMWILDSLSGKLRQGPSSLVSTRSATVGLVDDKIYIFDEDKIQAQMFDLKTQTWQIAPNPSMKVHSVFISLLTPSLDRKIYARNRERTIMVYDKKYTVKHFCVVDNVLYMYRNQVGLRWYNSTEKEWIIVHGLKLEGYVSSDVAMADYNGKLAFLWNERNKMEIWCSMITLNEISKIAIQGKVEWSSCVLSDVPSHYYLQHCLGPD